ncbi:MAG TPA: hypothetical protein VFC00_15780 [Micromonosporaceae bacterium]|nr:hypothetical protein [Micromonosporaceae bacterium]
MPGSRKLSPTVLGALLAAAVVGVAVVAQLPAETTLLGAFATAALLGLASVLIARRNAYLKRNQYFGRQPNGQDPQAPGQLLVLTVGLTAIATLAGFGAGWKSVSSRAPVVAAAPAPILETPALPSPSPTPTPEESPSPSAPASPSETADPTPTDGTETPDPGVSEPASETVAYLDSMDAVEGYVYEGAQYLSGKRYPRSVQMRCYRAAEQFNEWNVAGRTSFSATLGIADDADDSFGAIAEFIFYDQDGRQLGQAYAVSVGRPKPVQLNLTSVIRLRITCSGRDSRTNEARLFYAVLGDAYVKS